MSLFVSKENMEIVCSALKGEMNKIDAIPPDLLFVTSDNARVYASSYILQLFSP